jgi:hypothetical protein
MKKKREREAYKNKLTRLITYFSITRNYQCGNCIILQTIGRIKENCKFVIIQITKVSNQLNSTHHPTTLVSHQTDNTKQFITLNQLSNNPNYWPTKP